MASARSAAEYISHQASSASDSEAAAILEQIKDLHEKKLWHQLTEKVKVAVKMPSLSNKCGLYTNFMKEFETKLNGVSLVQIVISAARAELESEPAEGLAFITPLVEREGKKAVIADDLEACVLAMSEIARLNLQASNNDECKKYIQKARDIVDVGHDMAAPIHSAFYRAAAQYHKVVGTASDFFKNALQFLAYTAVESLEPSEQRQWAFDIGIAALVGTDVYNFGEVLSHFIVQVLKDSEHAWLLTLLESFNEGNLEKYDAVCRTSSEQMSKHPVLVASHEFLRQKITILALMELACTKSTTRTLSFKEVEEACRLPAEEVEFLLMRSMSLGVISGVIDNVSEEVSITRVQPRVLDRDSIKVMSERLAAWCDNVDDTLKSVSENSVAVGN